MHHIGSKYRDDNAFFKCKGTRTIIDDVSLMKIIFTGITIILALITFVFGGLWFFLGLETVVIVGGAGLPESTHSAALAMADNTIRFLSAIWIATGIGLVVCMRDIKNHITLYRVIMGGLFFGGIDRLLSFSQMGVVDTLIGPTIIDIVLPPTAIAVQTAVTKRT